eukprot:c20615_g1_i2 orf=434-829(-)
MTEHERILGKEVQNSMCCNCAVCQAVLQVLLCFNKANASDVCCSLCMGECFLLTILLMCLVASVILSVSSPVMDHIIVLQKNVPVVCSEEGMDLCFETVAVDTLATECPVDILKRASLYGGIAGICCAFHL